MRVLSFFILFFNVGLICGAVRGPPVRISPPEPHPASANKQIFFNFTQILDHNNLVSPKYWKQRAWYNDELVIKSNSKTPVYLMVEGEGTANPAWLNGGAWYYYARQYGAMLFLLEHRYYGQSHPTANTTTANLKYLTSQQALADISYFIRQMNKKYGYTSANRWVLFGGSYPGDLVAWARLHYPNDVYGAISSSGPLMAKADFYEYNDVVRNSLDYYVEGCSDAVTQAAQTVQENMKTQTGINTLMSNFSVCQGYFDASLWQDRYSFFQLFSGRIGGLVQYNGQGNKMSVTDFCDKYMTNTTIGSPVERLIAFINDDRKSKDQTGCVSASYKWDLTYYLSTAWNSSVVTQNTRQWMYQCCNEFGFYQTSPFTSSLFSDSMFLNFSAQECTDIFGKQFNQQQLLNSVRQTNIRNQGTDIKTTNTVFVQGNIDPWHSLGMVKTMSRSAPYVLIDGTSHCYDMLSPSLYDSNSLTNARNIVESNIKKWMNT